MEKVSKAIAAGLGGGLAGTAAVPFMPDGTPWYGYLAAYAIAILVPALITYIAPKNAP